MGLIGVILLLFLIIGMLMYIEHKIHQIFIIIRTLELRELWQEKELEWEKKRR